jgi:hypothetical protein
VVLAKVVHRAHINLSGHPPNKDYFMTRPILATEAKHHGDEFPPSRPSPMLFLIAAIVIAVVVVIMNWPTVATLTHFPQIKSSLGL